MTDGYKDIGLKAGILSTGWSIHTDGSYAYQLAYLGTSTGTVKISTTAKPGADDWEDYMMTGYANLATSPTTSNNRIGFILRYQDSDNYYFAGFATDKTNGGTTDSTYEVWKKESGSYLRVPNQYDTGNNNEGTSDYGLPEEVGNNGVLSVDTQYHLRVDLYDITMRMYISNVLVFENTTDLGTFTSGEVGFECWSASSAEIIGYFDTVKVAA